MKAIIRQKAGKAFSTMIVQEIPTQEPGAFDIKIRVVSSRINPVDMDLMKGFPSLKYKNPQIGGVDGAGEVIAIGEKVTRFKVGDKVFFYRLFSDIGTWAEEITLPEAHAAQIPGNISVKDAGTIALPLLTAFECLQTLHPKKGERILIHGAGGGVGFQAVTIAKQMGLYVIANGSMNDKSTIEKAGADEFIDYKQSDFSEILKSNPPVYILDVVGKETLRKSILLQPKTIISTTFPNIDQMPKAGVNLPGILKLLIGLMNRKMQKLAQKNGVKLLGQVTGANGEQLQQAAQLIEQATNYQVKPYQELSISYIEKQSLSQESVGKIIVF